MLTMDRYNGRREAQEPLPPAATTMPTSKHLQPAREKATRSTASHRGHRLLEGSKIPRRLTSRSAARYTVWRLGQLASRPLVAVQATHHAAKLLTPTTRRGAGHPPHSDASCIAASRQPTRPPAAGTSHSVLPAVDRATCSCGALAARLWNRGVEHDAGPPQQAYLAPRRRHCSSTPPLRPRPSTVVSWKLELPVRHFGRAGGHRHRGKAGGDGGEGGTPHTAGNTVAPHRI